MIVVATKLDATTDRTHLEELREFSAKRGLEFHAISSATGEGIVELVRAMADALDRIPKPAVRRRSGRRPLHPMRTPMPSRDDEARTTRRPTERIVDVPLRSQTAQAQPSPLRRAFRRHIRSDSRRPHRRGAGRAAPLSSRRHLFHSVLAPAAQIEAGAHAVRPSLRDGRARLRGPSGICAVARRSARRTAPLRTFSTRSTPCADSTASIPTIICFFIVGADQFLEIPTWKNYEALLDSCDFIIASRPGFRLDALRLVIPPEKLGAHAFARPAQNRSAQIDGPSAHHRRQPRLVHRDSRPARNAIRPSTGLCPRAWRNTFSDRPCTGDSTTLFAPKFAGPSKRLRTSRPWISRC